VKHSLAAVPSSLVLVVVGALALTGCDKLMGKLKKDEAKPAATAVSPGPVVPAATAPAEPDVPFAGTFARYAETTYKNGRRVVSSNTKGVSSLTVGQGQVVYDQSYTFKGEDVRVTQTYSYRPEDVRPVTGGFDVALTFVKMDSNTQSYSPDKNKPSMQVRKQAAGYQLGLLTTDNNGVSGGAEFR
jgi:hypothetical protein